MIVKVEVRAEHLKRARAEMETDTPACRCCVIAQALRDAGITEAECGAFTWWPNGWLRGAEQRAYTPQIQRIVDLFDLGGYRDDEILSLLPVVFEVEVRGE